MKLPITVYTAFDSIRIKFGDTLHFAIRHSRIIGVQSWRDYGGTNYFIEFVSDGGSIKLEYDDESKWKEILAGLEKLL